MKTRVAINLLLIEGGTKVVPATLSDGEQQKRRR